MAGSSGMSRSTSSSELTGYPLQSVFLNVYDLHEATTFLAPLGCGLFHVGVEVHGREFRYGRGDAGNGVEENPPRVCPPHTFREQFVLGVTPLSRYRVEELIESLQVDPAWDACKYQVVTHNCLHFAQYLAQQLLPMSCRVSLQVQHCSSPHTDPSPIFFVGGTREKTVTGVDGTPATALSAEQLQLPSLIPSHVDRLSRFTARWAPGLVLRKIDSWDKASVAGQGI